MDVYYVLILITDSICKEKTLYFFIELILYLQFA